MLGVDIAIWPGGQMAATWGTLTLRANQLFQQTMESHMQYLGRNFISRLSVNLMKLLTCYTLKWDQYDM